MIKHFAHSPSATRWDLGDNHHQGLPSNSNLLKSYLQTLSWQLNPSASEIIYSAQARTDDSLLVARSDGSLWFHLPDKIFNSAAPAIKDFNTAAINSDGTTAARLSNQTRLELVDLLKRKITKTWTVPHPTHDVTILDNGHLALTHLNGTITVWDPAHLDSPLRTIAVVPHSVTGFQLVAIPGKEEFLVCLDDDIAIRRYSATTGKLVGPVLRHKKGVFWMIITGDPDILFTIDQKETGPGALRIWSLRLAREIIPPLHHPDRVNWATILDQGSRIATSCADKIVRRWILEEGEKK